MAGRPDFQRVTAVGVLEAVSFITADESRSTSIGAGQTEIVDIYSPAGTLSRVLNTYLDIPAPAGATSGDQVLSLSVGTSFPVVSGNWAYNQNPHISRYAPTNSPTAYNPNDLAAFGAAIRAAEFDAVSPLRITYEQRTNVAQNNTRFYKFIFRCERVAP